MTHHALSEFWESYRSLPQEVQTLADEAFERLKENPQHPALHFRKVGRYWSARVGTHYRALAEETADGLVWIWIGTHADYDKLLG